MTKKRDLAKEGKKLFDESVKSLCKIAKTELEGQYPDDPLKPTAGMIHEQNERIKTQMQEFHKRFQNGMKIMMKEYKKKK